MAKKTSEPFQAVSITRSIAPKTQVDLGASDAHASEWQGIDSDIEMNVLALWAPGDSSPILFVSLDLLYPGQRIRSAVESAAPDVPADRIVVAASHTHRAPMTDDTKPALGTPDEGYLTWLLAELATTVKRVLQSPRLPVSLAAGDTLASHSINRRLRKFLVVARHPRFNDVVNAPNPAGPTDERVTALVVRGVGGRPIAVLWNYACHPVGGPIRNAVSSHFPGVARTVVRDAFDDPTLPVLFFQGFSGDVRPNASTKVHSVRRRLRRMVSGPLFEDMTWADYRAWCDGLSAALLRAIDRAAPIGETTLTAHRLVMPSDRIARGPDLGVMSFGRLTVGDSITIYTASGELVVDYSLRARGDARSPFVMCVGCTDQVVGYIPTKQVQDEGGYEGGGFARAFNLVGLHEGIEDVVQGAFHTLDGRDEQMNSAGLAVEDPTVHEGAVE